MNRIVPYVVCVVFTGALPMRAQSESMEPMDGVFAVSAPEPEAVAAPQEPKKLAKAPQPPTAEQIAKWVAELKAEENPHNLATRLSELGKTHATVKTALHALLADATVSPALFQAVVDWITGENDRSVAGLGTLASALRTLANKPARLRIVRAGLARMDRREPLMPVLIERITAPADKATPDWIAAALDLSRDDYNERCDLADALIGVLEAGSVNGIDITVRGALFELTLHEFGAPQEWRTWFDSYVKKRGKAGFHYPTLHKEVGSEGADAGVQRDIAAIKEFVKLGISPPDIYIQSPAPAVRREAYDGVFAAAGSDVPKRKAAADKLLTALADEPDVEARRRAIRHLGALAGGFRQNSLDIRGRIATVMLEQLKGKKDSATVALAVSALGKCRLRGKGHGDALIPVRNDHINDAGVRREIVHALNELKEADGIVILSLDDSDAAIARLAAEVLGRWGDRSSAHAHAVALADAWTRRKSDPATRRAFVLAIEVLGHFSDARVTDVLKAAVTGGQADQGPALTSILTALRSEGDTAPAPEVTAALRAFLVGFIPTKLEKPARESLEGQLGELKGNVGVVAVEWAKAEKDVALRTKLVSAIARGVATVPFAETVELARILETAKAWADAETLLTALVGRAGLGTAPEAESNRQADLKLRLAKVLRAQSRADEAEKVITDEITRMGTAATPDLYLARADIRLAKKNPAAVVDFEAALDKAGQKLTPADRKAILTDCARLEYDLKDYAAALGHATRALALGGPETGARLLQLRSAVLLRDSTTVDSAVASYEQLTKAGTTNLPKDVGAAMAPHIQVRTWVTQLDQGGAAGAKAAASLEAEKDKALVTLWLIRGLEDLPKDQKTHAALKARLALIKKLNPSAPPLPPANADQAALTKSTQTVISWWTTKP